MFSLLSLPSCGNSRQDRLCTRPGLAIRGTGTLSGGLHGKLTGLQCRASVKKMLNEMGKSRREQNRTATYTHTSSQHMECVWTSSSDEIMDSTGDRLEERQSEGGRERIKQSAAKCCKIGDAAGARKQLTNRPRSACHAFSNHAL